MTSTINHILGFETGTDTLFQSAEGVLGSKVSLVTSPAPPQSRESVVLKMDQDKTNSFYRSRKEFTASGKMMVGLYLQLDVLPLAGADIDFISPERASNNNPQLTLRIEDGTDDLLVIDQGGSEVASVSDPFTEATWHEIEFLWEKSTTSDFSLFIDRSSAATASSVDFDDGAGGDIKITMKGQKGNPLAGPTTTYISSLYNGIDTTDTDDFLGDFVVQLFKPDENGLSPNSTSSGATPTPTNNALSGDWANTSDNTNNTSVTYGPLTNGVVKCTGPYALIAEDSVARAAKWIWFGNGTVTSGDYHIVYGKTAEGSNSGFILTDESTTLIRTNKFVAVVQDEAQPAANRVPTFNQKFAIGIRNASSTNNINIREAWIYMLYKAPVNTRTATVYIRGGHIRGGHWR